jgi:hypothetical protein
VEVCSRAVAGSRARRREFVYVRGDVATLRNSLGAIARLADGRGVCVCVCVCVCLGSPFRYV